MWRVLFTGFQFHSNVVFNQEGCRKLRKLEKRPMIVTQGNVCIIEGSLSEFGQYYYQVDYPFNGETETLIWKRDLIIR